MNRYQSIFVILLCICLVATGCAETAEPVVETPEPLQEDPAAELEEQVTKIVEATKWRGAFLVSPLDLKAQDQDESGVSIDSTFSVSGVEAGTDLTTRLQFEPELAFDAMWPDNAEAVIIPQEPLSAGQVYKVSYTSPEGTQSWAFQTQEDFRLKRSIPRNEAMDVPVDAAIEWVFTRLDLKDIQDFVTIEPELKGVWQSNRGTWTFLPDKLEPTTQYSFTLSGDYATDEGETLGQPMSISFTTAELETGRPETWVQFEAFYHEKPEEEWVLSIYGRGFDPGETFPVRIDRYPDLEGFLEDLESQQVWMPWGRTPKTSWIAEENLTLAEEAMGTVIGSTSGWSSLFLSVPSDLPEGNYRLTMEIEGVVTRTLVQVHSLQAMVQASSQEIVFWSVDPETGEGIENLYVQTGDEIRRTDAEGIAVFRQEVDQDPLVVLAKKEGQQPLVMNLPRTWHYDHWEWSGYFRNPDYYSTIFTDRGLYQPSDQIEGWGVVQPKGQTIPERLTLALETWGEEATTLETTEVEVDQTGSFVFQFDLKDLMPQTYRIRAYDGETIVMAHPIDVGRYVKPDLVVEAQADKIHYQSGEDVNLDLACNFFDGTPAVGTELEVTYHDQGSHRETVRIDKNGKAKLTITPRYDVPRIFPESVQIYVRTKDEQNREVFDTVYIQVFPRDIWIQMETEIENGNAIVEIKNYKLDLEKANGPNRTGEVSDYFGDPIKLDLNVNVVEVYWEKTSVTRQYDPIEKRIIEFPNYTKRERPVTRFAFNSIEGGSFEFPVERDKSYRVRVETEDQQGRSVVVDQTVRDYWGRPDDSRSPYIDLRKPDWDTQYSIGESVSLELTRGDSLVDSFEENARFLVVFYHDGLREIRSYTTPTVEFTFEEADLPNLYVQALYFDGRQFLRSMPTVISYQEKDRALTIVLKTDQERYEPGDTATVDLTVENRDGEPVAANLYLAVVDEAFFAVRDQQVDVLQDLYRNIGYPNITRSTASTDGGGENMFGGAEGGGEGVSMSIRSDFRDTATVRQLQTDENGKVQYAFVLPDNLTSWRLTALGVTKDLQAGDQTGNIEVGLPFFLQAIGSDEYVSGDMPMVGYRTFGAREGTQVTHRLILKQGDAVVLETELEGRVGTIDYLGLPELKPGTYTLVMTSETEEAGDGIEKTIEVKEARNTSWVSFAYRPGDLFLYPYGELTIAPGEQGWLYREWRELEYSSSRRVDAMQAARIAQAQMNKWLDEELVLGEWPFEYQQYDGGFGLVAYGGADPVLTAKILASGLPVTMSDKAVGYLEQIVETGPGETEYAAALWGLASQDEPVLQLLKNAVDESETDEARLYLALGLAELGAEKEAMAIYEPMMRERAYTYGDRIFMKATDFNQERVDTMLAALVSIRLNRPEARDLYRYAKSKPPMNELNRLERVLFLQQFHVDPSIEGRVEAVTPDKTIDRILDVETFATYLMSAEELAKTNWRAVENVEMSLSAWIPVKELYQAEEGVLGLERQYISLGKPMEELEPGDVIEVRLRLQLDRSAPKGGYVISDVLPSNLRFMNATKRHGEHYWLENSGQQVTIHTWPEGKTQEVIVKARVIAPGTYQAEPAFVQARETYGQLNTNLFGFSEAQVIEVNVDEEVSAAE